MKNEICKIINL